LCVVDVTMSAYGIGDGCCGRYEAGIMRDIDHQVRATSLAISENA
jgi:hypothetical protein